MPKAVLLVPDELKHSPVLSTLDSAYYDFGDGTGPVPAIRHQNGGGWVARSAKVSETAYVGRKARVFGQAVVGDGARIDGFARVYGTAVIAPGAVIVGFAKIYKR